MMRSSIATRACVLAAVLLSAGMLCSSASGQTAANVNVTGSLSPDKVKRGRRTQASIVIDIPAGLHVQSNKPLDKFLIATKLDVEAPGDLRVGPALYPRAKIVKLKFSKTPVAVYEGHTVIRFILTVPAKFGGNSAEIKAHLRFQACNDDSCFPPVTREVKLWLNIE